MEICVWTKTLEQETAQFDIKGSTMFVIGEEHMIQMGNLGLMRLKQIIGYLRMDEKNELSDIEAIEKLDEEYKFRIRVICRWFTLVYQLEMQWKKELKREANEDWIMIEDKDGVSLEVWNLILRGCKWVMINGKINQRCILEDGMKNEYGYPISGLAEDDKKVELYMNKSKVMNKWDGCEFNEYKQLMNMRFGIIIRQIRSWCIKYGKCYVAMALNEDQEYSMTSFGRVSKENPIETMSGCVASNFMIKEKGRFGAEIRQWCERQNVDQ